MNNKRKMKKKKRSFLGKRDVSLTTYHFLEPPEGVGG
jgi:hypothetical protein